MSKVATKEQTVEELEAIAEALQEEWQELKEQRVRALREAEEANRELRELDEPRVTLSPAAFRGDEKAITELDDLEDQAERASRRLRLVRNAASELERMITEAEEAVDEAWADVHRKRAADLLAEEQALEAERDLLAGKLKAALDRQDDLTTAWVREVAEYDPKQVENHGLYNHGWRRRFLARSFPGDIPAQWS